MLSDCTVLPYIKETKVGTSNKEASPSAGKNTGVVLVHVMHGSASLQLLLVYGYFQGPWVSFVMTDDFSVRATKITSRIGVS